MAKMEFRGIDEYTAKLSRLSASLEEKVLGAAVYDGASVMADAVRAALAEVPTDESHNKEEKKDGPARADKEAVRDALGITPLRNDGGYVNRKIGFTKDYVGKRTTRYPRGRPVLMLARAIRSGTSWMQGHDFIKKAVKNSEKRAEAVMAARVEKEIEKIMN